MAKADVNGREYARIAAVKPGDYLEDDGGFGCFPTDDLHIVRQDDNGLYVDCDEGKHYLDGATDDGEHCVGLYCARRLDLTDRQLKLVRAAVAIAFVDDDAPVYDADDGYAEVGRLAEALGIPHPRA